MTSGAPAGVVRVAALGDIHCGRDSQGSLQPLFAEAAQRADVLALCGDLTDYGLPDEARILVRELTAAPRLTVVAVLGNHDYESGQQDEVKRILVEAGVHLLDGEGLETHGIGFAGVKGFCGGFGRRTLEPWGEEVTKRFVQEAVQETLKLESALAKLRTPQRVAVLHYAPIVATVQGEPPELFPFLGSSRLEEPLNRYGVAAVLHGHAHHGYPEGRTASGAPVYNVALPLLKLVLAGQPPLRIIEVPTAPPAERRAGDRRAGPPAEPSLEPASSSRR